MCSAYVEYTLNDEIDVGLLEQKPESFIEYKIDMANITTENMTNLKYLPIINNIEIYEHYAISNIDEFIKNV
jgi:hypothetical protein